LEYSFALANSGGFVDIKTDEKYSVILISTNKLNEVKKVNIYNYDKVNSKISNLLINEKIELTDSGQNYMLSDLIQRNLKSKSNIEKVLENNFGTKFAFVYISSSDNIELIEKLISGSGSIVDLLYARDLEGVSLRDLYFIYSFAGSVDPKDSKEVKINSLENYDRELRDLNIDSVLGKEGVSISILNASNINGLAKKYSRFVQNLGGRVIDTSNTDSISNESFVIYKEKTPGIEFLMSKMAIQKSFSIEEVGLKYPEIVKSDLVIVLVVDKGE